MPVPNTMNPASIIPKLNLPDWLFSSQTYFTGPQSSLHPVVFMNLPASQLIDLTHRHLKSTINARMSARERMMYMIWGRQGI